MNEIQCQKCGLIERTHYANRLPFGWALGAFAHEPHQKGKAFCSDCVEWFADFLVIEEEQRPLLGSEYDPEFDPSNWI